MSKMNELIASCAIHINIKILIFILNNKFLFLLIHLHHVQKQVYLNFIRLYFFYFLSSYKIHSYK